MKDFRELEKTFKDYVENGLINGYVMAIYSGENEIYNAVYGYRDYKRLEKLKTDNIFRLASMTKPITAVAVLIAKEQGLLDINDPISKFIPGFNHGGVGELINGKIHKKSNAREITLFDCLTHSSGLGSGKIGDFQFQHRNKVNDLEENVLSWNGTYLDFAPGTNQAYSAVVAYEIVAYIIEKVSGVKYNKFLEKEIFEPLGMCETGYSLLEKQRNRLVEMVKTNCINKLEFVDLGLKGFSAFEENYTGGSAGLFSTLDDYSHFVRMLSNGGIYKGVRIMSEQSVEMLRTPQLSEDLSGISDYFNWGLGVRVVKKSGEYQPLPTGSFGWSGAYGTHFWVEPSSGVSAILMLNKADVGGSASPFSFEFEKQVQRILN